MPDVGREPFRRGLSVTESMVRVSGRKGQPPLGSVPLKPRPRRTLQAPTAWGQPEQSLKAVALYGGGA